MKPISTLCVNPRCDKFPIRGSNLCYSCSTRRDALFLMGVMAGGLVVIFSIIKVLN